MPESKWIETEKESELINGEWVDKKKRYARPLGINIRTKETWDIIFKFFAAIAIFSPFMIIGLQNKSNVNRERKTNLSIVYAGILRDLRVYRNYANTNDTAEFRGVVNRLGAEYPAKLAVYGSDRITNIYDTVVRSMAIWEFMRDLRIKFNGIRDQTDRLNNMSDYMIRDSLFILTYKTYKADSDNFIRQIEEVYTEIDNARTICKELVASLSRENPRHFGELHQSFKEKLQLLNDLDSTNTRAFNDLANNDHQPNDEIHLNYVSEYDRLMWQVKNFEKDMIAIDILLSQKQRLLESEFRRELK